MNSSGATYLQVQSNNVFKGVEAVTLQIEKQNITCVTDVED